MVGIFAGLTGDPMRFPVTFVRTTTYARKAWWDSVTRKGDIIKPVLKWVGGKRQLIDDILPLVPDDPSLYVEPFVGGGGRSSSQDNPSTPA